MGPAGEQLRGGGFRHRILLFDDAFVEQAGHLFYAVEELAVAIFMGRASARSGPLSCEELIASTDPVAASTRGGDDMAGIFYTGGTTGFPKGVMQSHRAIWASAMGALLISR